MEINGITMEQAWDRLFQLTCRRIKVKTKFFILQEFHPVKSIFLINRFNKTLRRIKQAEDELKDALGIKNPAKNEYIKPIT